jgi:hypothetical protein
MAEATTNWIPNRKPVAGVIAASVTTVVVWYLGTRGIEVPADVAVASTGLITFIVSYLVPEAA